MKVNINKLSRKQRNMLYICNTRNIFDKRALFSDATSYYRSPQEPELGDLITLRIRVGRDSVDSVCVNVNGTDYSMKVSKSEGFFDYYETSFTLTDDKISYYFTVSVGTYTCYYNQAGVESTLNKSYNFEIIAGFHTPKWAEGAVIYQIFVDRFCDGNKSNNVLTGEYSYINEHVSAVSDWKKYPNAMGVREFYGGDLQGVINKLDYLQQLGVEAIYFNPLFVSPSNHKYDIQDYDNIDPHFGVIVEDGRDVLDPGDQDNTHAATYIKRVTEKKNLEASNQLFAKLTQEAHQRGIKVIIDGVFNHCGSFNKWLDRERIYQKSSEAYEAGAFIEKESPYNSFFRFYNDEWPDNASYDSWWGMETLPKLNYQENSKLEKYIISIAQKWCSAPYNVDGWRLDVAADLGYSKEYNHSFWKKFRSAVKAVNPEAIIIAEHYGDSYDWLQGDEWDTVMNYDAFMEPVTWFLTGMQKHSDEFRKELLGNAEYFFSAMKSGMARMGQQCYDISMNELSNHDHSRFLTRTNRTVGRTATLGPQAAEKDINKAVFMEAVVIQMTWPGCPTVYYGDEAGLCGWTDPDNRRTYPWGNEDLLLLQFHREIISLHKGTDALRRGSYKPLYAAPQRIAYARFTDKEVVIVAVNNDENEAAMNIRVWDTGLTDNDKLERVFVTSEDGFSTEGENIEVINGHIMLEIRKTSAVVLRKIKC